VKEIVRPVVETQVKLKRGDFEDRAS
jgi:hypothetical protein